MADIILIVILIIFARSGSRKGLVKTLFGTMSTLLSLVLTALIYSPFSKMLYNSTAGDYITSAIRKLFEEKIQAGADILMLDKAVEAASILIINVLSFVIVVIITKIILMFISSAINITAKLPVIKQLNSILGMVAGVVSGILVCYILIGIIGALNGDGNISIIQESIKGSYIAIKLYENNFIANLILSYI